MEQIIIPLILIGGIIGGVYLTRWANWYAFGENQAREEAMEKRREERARLREEGAAKVSTDADQSIDE
jgi:hypothetical protein